MSLWILGFYGSVFGGYVLYYYASRNYIHFLYIMGKVEAYGEILYKKISSYFKNDTKKLTFVIPDNIDIKFKELKDQLTQCRVNNLSETSDTCKYKFMLIEVAFTEFTTEKKFTVSLENKDNNFTAYVSNNKIDKHFWKWYLESFYNDQVKSVFSRCNVLKYSITIMDNKYKHVKINQDDTIWFKKFNYEIIKPNNSEKVFQPISMPKNEQKKRRNFNGEDYSDDEDSILSCPNLANPEQISQNPSKYYKMNNIKQYKKN